MSLRTIFNGFQSEFWIIEPGWILYTTKYKSSVLMLVIISIHNNDYLYVKWLWMTDFKYEYNEDFIVR